MGKTTLARRLAERLGARLLLEPVRGNPFLPLFYDDPARYALATQLYFLLERWRRQREVTTHGGLVIGDHLFEKDLVFADLNLKGGERNAYMAARRALIRLLPRPDLVVFLTAEVRTLAARIRKRGRAYEADMDPDYLQALRRGYTRLFRTYRKAPVLRVATDEHDLPADPVALDDLARRVRARLRRR